MCTGCTNGVVRHTPLTKKRRLHTIHLYTTQLCNDWALGGKGGMAKIKGDIWGMNTVFLSFLDWPLRRYVVMLRCGDDPLAWPQQNLRWRPTPPTSTCDAHAPRLSVFCRLLGTKLMGRTKLCRPGSHAYDEAMAKAVWEVSAEFAGVPVEPQA